MTETIYPVPGWRPDDGQIHVGDVGTRLTVEFFDQDGNPVDVTDADVLEIEFMKPGATVWVAKTATQSEGVPDANRAYYAAEDADEGEGEGEATPAFLDTAGEWEMRGYAELADGWKGHTGTYHFPVYA